MPNKKRNESNDPFSKGRGGAMEELHDQHRETEGMLSEGVEQVGETVREGYETVRGAVSSGYKRVHGLAASHPTPSVLIGFGLGLGLGILLTVAITQREEPSWRDWRLSDSLHHLQDKLRHRS
jgi:hypothetical protein